MFFFFPPPLPARFPARHSSFETSLRCSKQQWQQQQQLRQRETPLSQTCTEQSKKTLVCHAPQRQRTHFKGTRAQVRCSTRSHPQGAAHSRHERASLIKYKNQFKENSSHCRNPKKSETLRVNTAGAPQRERRH